MSVAPRELLKPGGKFGDYTVVRLLGAGGMGSVYLIRGDASGNEFAVKILNPALEKDDPEYKQRFIFEAELAMAIRHENLITVYDMGRDPETSYGYILMEYVPGGTVYDRLAKWGALSVEEASDIACRVAKALAAIDAHHVVHRDVKPENIMFTADGVTPKLADLGVARLSTGGTRATSLTQAGYILGSPAYMPAEQMENPHTADIRADIYALGATFWQMLVGRPPYDGEAPLAVVGHVMNGEAIPDVRRFRPDVPAPIAELIVRMTHPKVAQRVQKPMEVAEAIEQAMRETREQAAPRGGAAVRRPVHRVRPRTSKSLWFGLAALAASFAVCVMAVTMLVKAVRTPAIPPPPPTDPLSVLPAGEEPSAAESAAVAEPAAVPAMAEPDAGDASAPGAQEAPPAAAAKAEPPPAPRPAPQKAAPKPPAASAARPIPAAQFAETLAPELRRYASYRRMAAVRETRAEASQAVLKAVNDARLLDPDMRVYDLDGTSGLPGRPALPKEQAAVLRAGKVFLALELVRAGCPKLMENYAREKSAATAKLRTVRPLSVDDVVDLLGRAAGRDLFPLFRELGVKADAAKSTLRADR